MSISPNVYNSENNRNPQETFNIKEGIKHNRRKHPLGEIKNLIHNQNHAITPVTPTQNKGLHVPRSSHREEFCADLLKQTSDGHQLKEIHLEDLPTPIKCTQNCGKSLEVIWSEMSVLEPEILERLVNGDGDIEEDFDISKQYIPPPFDFDELSFRIEAPDPCEVDSISMLEKILAEDREFPNVLPVADDWVAYL